MRKRYISTRNKQGQTLEDVWVDKYAVSREGLMKVHEGPFSALVSKDDDYVYAVDSDGKTIAEGEAGVDDASVIQQALDSLTVGRTWKEKVLVMCECEISSEITVPSKAILSGGCYKLKAGGRVVFSEDVKLEDFVFENAILYCANADRIPISIGGANPKRRIVIRNITIFDRSGESIWVGGDGGVHDSLLENIWFINCERGVRSNHLTRSVIRNIYGYECKREIVLTAGYAGETYYPHDCVIENVVLYNTTPIADLVSAGYNPMPVDITRTAKMIVRNIYGVNVTKGVNMEPVYTGDVDDETLVENGYFENVWRSAVYITDARRCTVRRVYAKDVGLINDTDDAGIHGILFNAYYSTLELCKIENARGHGIALGSGRNQNIIRNNRIISPNYENAFTEGVGISLYSVENVLIEGNIIEDEVGYMTYAIREYGTSNNNLIGDNIIRAGTISWVGVNTVVKRNIGYLTENSGTATFSGDGTTTQFSIEHGLVSTPSKIQVTAMSSDAAGDFYVTADATYIYVNYNTAPPSGIDNVKLSWSAEV